MERAESEGDVFESKVSIYINLLGPVALEQTQGTRMTRVDKPPYLVTRIERQVSRQMGCRGKLFANLFAMLTIVRILGEIGKKKRMGGKQHDIW